MKKSLTINLLALAMLAAAGSAQAVAIFHATLTHDQEVIVGGIPDEGSSGTAIFILNDARTQLTYDVRLFGLDLSRVAADGNPNIPADDPNLGDDALRMHIHRAIVGSNGNIVYGMIDANPLLRNDSNIPTNNLDIDVAGLHITGIWDLGEGSQVPGQQTTLDAELDNLFAGLLYINVHTADHTGGEIRGQITVPEPGTWALFGIGSLGLIGPALRRRR